MNASKVFSSLGIRAVLTLVLTGAAALVQAQSRAAEPLGEITVTATMRESMLIDVPASVSVLDRQALADAGEQHFQDVLGLVPNLNWAAGELAAALFSAPGRRRPRAVPGRAESVDRLPRR